MLVTFFCTFLFNTFLTIYLGWETWTKLIVHRQLINFEKLVLAGAEFSPQPPGGFSTQSSLHFSDRKRAMHKSTG